MESSEQHQLTRIGVIGDIHAEAAYLATALSFLQSLNLPTILCTGDIVDGRGSVNHCCRLLQGSQTITVRGNRDRWFTNQEARQLPEATQSAELDQFSQEFLAHLPITRDFKTTAGDLLLCHGFGPNDMGRLLPEDEGYAVESNQSLQDLLRLRRYRFVINGHTHRRLVRTFGILTLINAGTLKHDHGPGFLTVDFGTKIVQYYNFDQAAKVVPDENFQL